MLVVEEKTKLGSGICDLNEKLEPPKGLCHSLTPQKSKIIVNWEAMCSEISLCIGS